MQRRLAAQDLAVSWHSMRRLRAAVPPATPTFWDMTILAYWAWSAFDPRDGTMHSAQGAGGLGYGFPAALGAAVADPAERPVSRSPATAARCTRSPSWRPPGSTTPT